MTATASASNSATGAPSQQRQLLLLQKEVFTIYLEPLLKLHAANQVVTYEDLTSSWQAAVAAFSQSTIDTTGKTTVRAKLTALHQSQIKAYRAAATAALTEWADTVSLPDIHSHETLEQYVLRCRTVTAAARPAWRDGTSQRQPEIARIEERAKEAYTAQKEAPVEVEDGEEEEEEEGEIEEENAVADVTPTPNDDEDEGEIDETAEATTDTKPGTKNIKNKVSKPSPQRNNKPAFVKKTTVTKPKINPPPARSVRGGRGGGRGSSARGGRGGK